MVTVCPGVNDLFNTFPAVANADDMFVLPKANVVAVILVAVQDGVAQVEQLMLTAG